jgi:hypothetical protein
VKQNILEHPILRRRPARRTAGSAMHIQRESAEIRGTHHRFIGQEEEHDATQSNGTGKQYRINQNMNRQKQIKLNKIPETKSKRKIKQNLS